MRRRRWLLIVIAPVLVLGALLYQLIAPRSHLLFPPRASNGVDYVLYTHVPDGCQAGGCPALYILDGERWISLFTEIDDTRSARRQMNPVILVGIGYRDIVHTASRRKHDFTPSFGNAVGQTGGADAYLQALRHDIIPYAESHLPIARDQRGIAGHSYGGLLAAYALATTPDLFNAYLIMSPALWFDNYKMFDTPPVTPSTPRRVFLAADTTRGGAFSAMARDVARLDTLLIGKPNISVSRSIFPGTIHDTMVEPAVTAGLPVLYGGEETP